jgi:hypothetical protein
MKSEDYVSVHLSQVNPITSNTVVSQGKVSVGLSSFFSNGVDGVFCFMQNGIQVNVGIDRSIEVDGVPTILIGNGRS